MDLQAVENYALGYKFLYDYAKVIGNIRFVPKDNSDSAQNDLAEALRVTKSFAKNLILSGNMRNLDRLDTNFAAYSKKISEYQKKVISYLNRLANKDYNFDISLLRNNLNCLEKYTVKFNDRINSDFVSSDVITGLAAAESEAEKQFIKQQQIVNRIYLTLTNQMKDKKDKINYLQIERDNTLIGAFRNWTSDLSGNDKIEFQTNYGEISNDATNEDFTHKQSLVSWTAVIGTIAAITSLVVEVGTQVANAVFDFNEKSDKLIHLQKEFHMENTLASVANNIETSTERMQNALHNLNSYIGGLAGAFSERNKNRTKIINDTRASLSSGWNDPSKADTFRDLYIAFTHEDQNLHDLYETYSGVRAGDHNKTAVAINIAC
ncbi:hypothetical protein [Photorhabdus stackebrandtii]|uniref:Uncharacterized protein n=1 Tax=Photorhabdus stackebrandtii TaxID=1123042 RepID=A0A7X5TNI6_9GAMM|nr:hypothetical protein [Photorhabdus stackebrandtii]NHB98779.1 hypothetical protein [Photorhabdus stackebrandtii]